MDHFVDLIHEIAQRGCSLEIRVEDHDCRQPQVLSAIWFSRLVDESAYSLSLKGQEKAVFPLS